MKQTMRIVIYMTLIMAFFSCKEQEKKVPVDVQSMSSILLEGELLEEELLTPNTVQMEFIQSKLFLFTPQHEVACLIVNEYADTLGYLAGIGSGPGELNQWPYFAGTSINQDTVYMFDTMSKNLNAYSLSISSETVGHRFLGSKKMKEGKRPEGVLDNGIFKLIKLENGYYVGLRLLNSKDLFTLFDENLNEVKRFGDYPFYDGLDKETDYRMTGYFNGILKVQGNSLYYAVTRFAYMARYDIGNDGTITKVWDNFYAKVHSLPKDNNIYFHGDNIEGFTDFAIGKKYIYAAYSGVESGEAKRQRSAMALYPKTLLVLDLNGTPLAKFDLGKRYFPLCIDEKEEYIYIRHNDPDVSLWRYKVSDILEHIP